MAPFSSDKTCAMNNKFCLATESKSLGFWGLVVEPGKVYSQTVPLSFKITMAALGPDTKVPESTQGEIKKSSRSTVMLVHQKDGEFALCSLVSEQCNQQSLDIVFLEGEEIHLRVTGPESIHLTGYYINNDEEDYDEDYSEGESLDGDEDDEGMSDEPNSDDEDFINDDEEDDEEIDSDDFDSENEEDFGSEEDFDSEEEEERIRTELKSKRAANDTKDTYADKKKDAKQVKFDVDSKKPQEQIKKPQEQPKQPKQPQPRNQQPKQEKKQPQPQQQPKQPQQEKKPQEAVKKPQEQPKQSPSIPAPPKNKPQEQEKKEKQQPQSNPPNPQVNKKATPPATAPVSTPVSVSTPTPASTGNATNKNQGKNTPSQESKNTPKAENTPKNTPKNEKKENAPKTENTPKIKVADEKKENSTPLNPQSKNSISTPSTPSSASASVSSPSLFSKTFANGLKVEDIKLGQGAKVNKGKRLGITYSLKTESGKEISSSKGNNLLYFTPYQTTNSTEKISKALQLGVQGMILGGERKITIPSSFVEEADIKPAIPKGENVTITLKLEKVDNDPSKPKVIN